ncbi:hypothetical protein BDP81DRAFT_432783 [Colletotrichum phormii]|uniref:Uncharacterized protein n=1 Tax=Colletotrichum phormii TaxID=359342 RepID=A0AAI9ZM11_9PEZI|nr:uncharacterized protein BDP81DRAFT_432783 [Colletotrichum phormii]KAK1634414.1 hypothetical protein BDP81DRAFT_432783 [Colletotrichum phormii]
MKVLGCEASRGIKPLKGECRLQRRPPGRKDFDCCRRSYDLRGFYKRDHRIEEDILNTPLALAYIKTLIARPIQI